MTNTHVGPVMIRANKRGGVTVLCPFGHLIDSSDNKSWVGSSLEARVGAHQAGTRRWIVECNGTLPTATPIV